MKLPMKARAYPCVGSFTSHPAESPAIKELHSPRSHEDHEAVLRIPATRRTLRGFVVLFSHATGRATTTPQGSTTNPPPSPRFPPSPTHPPPSPPAGCTPPFPSSSLQSRAAA